MVDPDQTLGVRVTVRRAFGVKLGRESHHTVGRRTATTTADGDTGAVSAMVQAFGQRGH